MKRSLLALVIALTISFLGVSAGASTGLKIQPLEYTAELDDGQRQRGVVDISNPSDEPVEVALSTQAARQVNNDGELEFYDDEAIEAGVRLDQKQITLPAKGAYRLVFELDGSKLPSGDSVAAIFAQTVGDQGSLSGSARVGTLLFIANGTASGDESAILALDIDLTHTAGEVKGRYVVANLASSEQSTGFRPEITTQLWPFHQPNTSTGPLVFAGRERVGSFTIPSSAVGVYKLTVSSGNSQQSRWVLLLPAWSALLAIGLLFLAASWRYVLRRRK